MKRLGQNANSTFVLEFKKGGFLFCSTPFGDSNIDNDSNWCSLLEVFCVEEDCVKAREILIATHCITCSNEIIEIDFQCYRKALKTKSIFMISKDIFNQAVDIIQQLTTKIISEIKCEFDK